MPALGSHLDFAKYEARNAVVQNGNPNPVAGMVKGQLFFNNSDNVLYWFDGTDWQTAKAAGAGGPPTGNAGGDLAGTYPNPTIGLLKVTDSHVAAANKDGTAGTPSLRTLGTGAQQAASGADSRLSDSRAPNGNAGGDLSGTYPNPQIASGVIVDADINAGAAIAKSKLAALNIVNADVAAGAAIALAKLATDPLARANHTGTQLAATISDFDTQVRTSRLDQMAPPTGALSANSQKITNLAAPTVGSDAANMAYVDNVAQGLDVKNSVKGASTANIASLSGSPGTVDAVTYSTGERILLKDQTTQAQNGIYVVNTAGAWTRATDMDSWSEVPGAFVVVEQGTNNAETAWICTADQGGTLGSTAITFTQMQSAASILAGNGLLRTGNTIDIVLAGGAASGLSLTADSLAIGTGLIVNPMIGAGEIDLTAKVKNQLPVANGGTAAATAPAARTNLGASGYYSSATHGAGTTITITQATHGLRASRGLLVQVQEEATGNVVLPDISVAASGDVTVTFGASVSANSYRVTVIG